MSHLKIRSKRLAKKTHGRRYRRPAKWPLGALRKLPQEIRDIIYGLVFAAGDPTLARTSKAIHTNSARALALNGVHRIIVKSYPVFLGTQLWRMHWVHEPVAYKTVAKARNLELRISEYGEGPPTGDSQETATSQDSKSVIHNLVKMMKRSETFYFNIESDIPWTRGSPLFQAIDYLCSFKRSYVDNIELPCRYSWIKRIE